MSGMAASKDIMTKFCVQIKIVILIVDKCCNTSFFKIQDGGSYHFWKKEKPVSQQRLEIF